MRRSGIWILVPPGRAWAIAIRSEVLRSRKAVRLRRAIRALSLIGGRTAKFLILTIYGLIRERGQGGRLTEKANRAPYSASALGDGLGLSWGRERA